MVVNSLNNRLEKEVDIIELLGNQSKFLPKRYKLMDLLSDGLTSSIFLARDKVTTRRVAIKFLSDTVNDTSLKDEFIRESKILASLEHPNIVPVHDISIESDECLFYTMKLLDGMSFTKILNKIRYKDPIFQKDYPLNLLLHIFLKICDGVRFSHSKKVLNLGLSSSVITVGKLGEVYIINWSSARFLGGNKNIGSNTVHDLMINTPLLEKKQLLGKPGFVAPEQIENSMGSDSLDETTDIFSLGAILYNILTLTSPFKGKEDKDTLENTLHNSHKDILENSPWLNINDLALITDKALSKKTKDRYRTVKKLTEDVSSFIRGEETTVNPYHGLKKILKSLKKDTIH